MRTWSDFAKACALVLVLVLAFSFVAISQENPPATNRSNNWTAPQPFGRINQIGPALNTTGTPAAGYAGIATLAANTVTVTFPTAYTNIPVCVVTDQTTPQLVKSAPTASTLVITDTVGATDVVAWTCFGNPN